MKNFFGKTEKYEDIIYLKHPRSKNHPPMPVEDRAAQFAPFAALTGYGDAINETSRLTEARTELDEEQREILDQKLSLLKNHLKENPELTVTYFLPDALKEGGSYEKYTGHLHKIDEYSRTLVMTDGKTIKVQDIVEIEIKEEL